MNLLVGGDIRILTAGYNSIDHNFFKLVNIVSSVATADVNILAMELARRRGSISKCRVQVGETLLGPGGSSLALRRFLVSTFIFSSVLAFATISSFCHFELVL